MEIGLSASVYSAYSSVRSIPRTSPSELTISVTTRPQPPCRFTRRRNALSVMPAIGAMANGDAKSTEPILMMRDSICFYVRGVDFDRHRLANQIDREHEPGALRVLAHQTADNAAKRPVRHLDHHAFANERARVVLQLAGDQQADALELVLRYRRRLSLKRDDVDDAAAFQHRQRIGRIEPREAIAGEQRPVDLLLAILPAAPARDRRKKGV